MYNPLNLLGNKWVKISKYKYNKNCVLKYHNQTVFKEIFIMNLFHFFITIIFLSLVNSSFALDLTDEERRKKDEFVHKGVGDRALEEHCQKKGDLDQLPDACKGRQLKT